MQVPIPEDSCVSRCMMSVTTLDLPPESLVALHVSSDQIGMALRMAAAMKYYEMGVLSSGAAARLAGVPRTVFLTRLADYGIDTFQLTEEQLQREVRLA